MRVRVKLGKGVMLVMLSPREVFVPSLHVPVPAPGAQLGVAVRVPDVTVAVTETVTEAVTMAVTVNCSYSCDGVCDGGYRDN